MKVFVFFLFLAISCATSVGAPEPGLLFYLSGDKEFTPDFAAGHPETNFLRGVTMIPDGAKGPGFQCADSQLMTYWAPGNIYGQRGTLSFYWRSRYAVGPTEFPIFRVAYADHSSWDMVWLRIDYNGHGFDAFVTDANLARTRVSITLQPFPKPDEWTHLALAWDETRGIRFYVNGKLAGVKETTAVYNTGLDQFGPHSRIISPHQVQSAYNFVRGGDMDELRSYDRMLSDENIATLAKGEGLPNLAPLAPRELSDTRYRDEWYLRYGWNRPIDPPPYYSGEAVTVRKVEIHDTYDGKKWFWKGTDGIRETTWPGVYNRSRLPGRNDYFQLPDWDCYADSGKAITFVMPDEPWNHLEIAGAAWGKMELLARNAANDGPGESILFRRPRGQEKTINTFSVPISGRNIRYTNEEQEVPIGELAAYNVHPGREPQGTAKLTFQLNASAPVPASMQNTAQFIQGRFPADERQMMVAQPVGLPTAPAAASAQTTPALPLVHILIPDSWDNRTDGLDGIAIDLPAMNVKPTHGELFPLNIQVKDPGWLYRNMLDFTFSIKPGEAKTLWLDLRDRILPVERGFYITIAGAGADFTPALLQGAQIRLVFKSRNAARPEHEIDRFTQARDNFGMMAEEHPGNSRLNLWNRYIADLTELLRVNPNHVPGIYYGARSGLGSQLPNMLAQPTPGVPLWAFRQVELLGRYKRYVNWYIDNRQSAFGDFGGGLPDDNDLSNIFPGMIFMGSDPEKITDSLRLILEAHYKDGMFTNGINTIQTDDLHSFEEGTTCLGQNLILDYGNPRTLERAMESAHGAQTITGINAQGHRLIRSFYFSATKIAQEEPWGWSRPNDYMMFQPTELLIAYNNNPTAIKFLAELADGLLAHRSVDPATGRGSIPGSIRFVDGAEGGGGGAGGAMGYVFWTLWRAIGDRKYLDPVLDGGQGMNPYSLYFPGSPAIAAVPAPAPAGGAGRGGRGGGGGGRGGIVGPIQLAGDKISIANSYTSAIQDYDSKEYLYTHGNFWIDRTLSEGSQTSNLQRTRLGGIVHNRNDLLPGHVVSWKFQAPANDQSVAFLVGDATNTGFKVLAYNLETTPVHVTMTGWNIDPGIWDITQGIDTRDDGIADQSISTRSAPFETSSDLELTLAPRATTVLVLKLKTPGIPYAKRSDLGIAKEDIFIQGNTIGITIHSVGAIDAPAATINLVDKSGKILASSPIPALRAPLDLFPKTASITITIPAGVQIQGTSLIIDPGANVTEITRRNDRVTLN